jgi:hypothetical protein
LFTWSFSDVWCFSGGTNTFPQLKMPSIITNVNVPASITYGEVQQITLSATTNNSTTPILYTSSNNDVAEIIGNILTIKKAGSVSITASQANTANYSSGSITVNLTINKKELIITVNDASIIYGDALPQYSCQYTGLVNGETENELITLPKFTCPATSQSNVGNYTITPSGAVANNYTFTYQTGILTIEKRNLRVIPTNVSRIYGANNPTFTLSYEGFVNGNTISNISTKPTASTLATQYSNAGEYDITCSGGNATNYDFTYEIGTLTIKKAPLTVKVNNASRNYGLENTAFTISYSGFINSETQTVLIAQPQAITTATIASNAGTYPITLSGGEALNYEFNYVNGTLTINKVTLTIKANNASMIYGDTPPQYTCQYSGFVNNENENALTTLAALTCNATSQSNAGSYNITPSGAVANNYTFTYQTGILTIEKHSLHAIPDNVSRAYGNNNPIFTLHYSGFVNNDGANSISYPPTTSTTATNYTNVGEYEITCSGGNATNYYFVYGTGKLTILKLY